MFLGAPAEPLRSALHRACADLLVALLASSSPFSSPVQKMIMHRPLQASVVTRWRLAAILYTPIGPPLPSSFFFFLRGYSGCSFSYGDTPPPAICCFQAQRASRFFYFYFAWLEKKCDSFSSPSAQRHSFLFPLFPFFAGTHNRWRSTRFFPSFPSGASFPSNGIDGPLEFPFLPFFSRLSTVRVPAPAFASHLTPLGAGSRKDLFFLPHCLPGEVPLISLLPPDDP